MFESIILGLVQGVTEFVPVSSSGHLVLAEKIFHIGGDNFTFDALLNIGTILALVIYFRREFIDILRSLLTKDRLKSKIAWLVALSTVPGVIAGLLVQDASQTYLRSTYLVCAMLVLVAIAMIFSEKVSMRKRSLDDITISDGLVVGLAQVLAFLPGTSRSGITIVAGLQRGFSRQVAAKFSFYLALPILFGGVLKVIFNDGTLDAVASNLVPYTLGIAASFCSGIFAVSFLLKYLQRNSLRLFAYYRIALAGIILLTMLIE